MIIYSWGTKVVDSTVVRADCAQCRGETEQTLASTYDYWGVWYIFNFSGPVKYKTVCHFCGIQVDAPAEEAAPMLPPPAKSAMDQFGCVIFMVLGLLLVMILTVGGGRR